jgi:hypothetical protein
LSSDVFLALGGLLVLTGLVPALRLASAPVRVAA